MPYQTLEAVPPLGHDKLAIVNDTNVADAHTANATKTNVVGRKRRITSSFEDSQAAQPAGPLDFGELLKDACRHALRGENV
jgi:hypothetical protein